MKNRHPFLLLLFAVAVWLCPQFTLSISARPVQKYETLIRDLSEKHNVSAALIHSIIKAESNYNPFAISSKGAVGLMQLMPTTAQDYGVRNIYDPEENIEAGIKHFKYLMSLYDNKLNIALAAYNAGQEAVEKYNGIPPYPETQNYIRRILAYYTGNGRSLPEGPKYKIYTYYSSSGRLVITNIPHLQKVDRRKIFSK